MDSAPSQNQHVEPTVDVRRVPIEQCCCAVPLGKHRGMPRPTFHPDAVDREMESGQNAAHALEPAAQGFFVVALTTERVGSGNAVMDTRRDCFHSLGPAMVVYVVEA